MPLIAAEGSDALRRGNPGQSTRPPRCVNALEKAAECSLAAGRYRLRRSRRALRFLLPILRRRRGLAMRRLLSLSNIGAIRWLKGGKGSVAQPIRPAEPQASAPGPVSRSARQCVKDRPGADACGSDQLARAPPSRYVPPP